MAIDKTGYVSVGAEVEDEVMPDKVIFRIGFGGRRDTREGCLDDYTAERALVTKALAAFDLDGELTCRGYTCFANTSRKKGNILGYRYYAYGTVSAPLEKTDVGAVWAALNTCGSHADMQVDFDLYDRRAAEDALIARAVERARGNARALAAASGTKLAGVKHISYNGDGGHAWICNESVGCVPDGGVPDGGNPPYVDLEPEPIQIECSVDVEWWLE